MKKLGKIIGCAAVLGGAVAASATLAFQQVGIPLSDAEAATVRGGICVDPVYINCASGACGSGAPYTGGKHGVTTPAGDVTCTNASTGACQHCYNDQTNPCGT